MALLIPAGELFSLKNEMPFCKAPLRPCFQVECVCVCVFVCKWQRKCVGAVFLPWLDCFKSFDIWRSCFNTASETRDGDGTAQGGILMDGPKY